MNKCDEVGGRILSIHSRNSAAQVIKCLSENLGCSTPILHWFSGSLRELNNAISLGCWFSVGPAMFSSSRGRDRIALMPIDRILLETDGPFTRDNGNIFEPIHTRSLISELAKIWELPIDDAIDQLRKNLNKIDLSATKYALA